MFCEQFLKEIWFEEVLKNVYRRLKFLLYNEQYTLLRNRVSLISGNN